MYNSIATCYKTNNISPLILALRDKVYSLLIELYFSVVGLLEVA